MAPYVALVEAIESLISEGDLQGAILLNLPAPTNADRENEARPKEPKKLTCKRSFATLTIDAGGRTVGELFPHAPGATFQIPLPCDDDDWAAVESAEFYFSDSLFAQFDDRANCSPWWNAGRLFAYCHKAAVDFGERVKLVDSEARRARLLREILFPLHELLHCQNAYNLAASRAPVEPSRRTLLDDNRDARRVKELGLTIWAWLGEVLDEPAPAPDAILLSARELAALAGVSEKTLRNHMSDDRARFGIQLGTGAGRASRKWEYNAALRRWLLHRYPEREALLAEKPAAAKQVALNQLSQSGQQAN